MEEGREREIETAREGERQEERGGDRARLGGREQKRERETNCNTKCIRLPPPPQPYSQNTINYQI